MSTPTSHFCSGFSWSPVHLLARSWVCPHKPTHGADTGICIRTRKGLQAWSKLREVLSLLARAKIFFRKQVPSEMRTVRVLFPLPLLLYLMEMETLRTSTSNFHIPPREGQSLILWFCSSSFVRVAYIFLFATDYVNWLWCYCLCQQVGLVFITHFFLFLGVGNCTGSRTAL